jgi:DDE domain
MVSISRSTRLSVRLRARGYTKTASQVMRAASGCRRKSRGTSTDTRRRQRSRSRGEARSNKSPGRSICLIISNFANSSCMLARPTNDSWRVDETYIRVKGKWVYLYRAVDSTGATIDFLLSAKRDAVAAERFLAKAISGANNPAPRVINTDKHAGYPPAIAQLKAEGALEENCRHRPVQYLNNVLEQDHRPSNAGSARANNFVRFGAWHFSPGVNFVLRMQEI